VSAREPLPQHSKERRETLTALRLGEFLEIGAHRRSDDEPVTDEERHGLDRYGKITLKAIEATVDAVETADNGASRLSASSGVRNDAIAASPTRDIDCFLRLARSVNCAAKPGST
jgi:hypothetical protein